MEIRQYVVINDRDETVAGDSFPFDTLSEAIERARDIDGPTAVVARVFTYDDSELVWTSDGSDVWPPKASEDGDDESR